LVNGEHTLALVPGTYGRFDAWTRGFLRDTEMDTNLIEMMAVAHRHVQEGEEQVRRQVQIIEQLHADGHPTDIAEELLLDLEQSLALHVQHLERVRAELASRRVEDAMFGH
jgi:hypothetical protein